MDRFSKISILLNDSNDNKFNDSVTPNETSNFPLFLLNSFGFSVCVCFLLLYTLFHLYILSTVSNFVFKSRQIHHRSGKR